MNTAFALPNRRKKSQFNVLFALPHHTHQNKGGGRIREETAERERERKREREREREREKRRVCQSLGRKKNNKKLT